jgi:hypothetical protein
VQYTTLHSTLPRIELRLVLYSALNSTLPCKVQCHVQYTTFYSVGQHCLVCCALSCIGHRLMSYTVQCTGLCNTVPCTVRCYVQYNVMYSTPSYTEPHLVQYTSLYSTPLCAAHCLAKYTSLCSTQHCALLYTALCHKWSRVITLPFTVSATSTILCNTVLYSTQPIAVP